MSVTFSPIENETQSVNWEPTQCTTISGSFDVFGLRRACRAGSTSQFDSPAIGGGVWRFCIDLHRDLGTSTDATRWVQLTLCMAAKPQSSRGHHNSRHYEFGARAFAGDTQIAEYRTAAHRYAPGDSVQIDEFLSVRELLDMEELQLNDTITIEYDIAERPRDAHRRPLGLDPAPYDELARAAAGLFDDPYTADVAFVLRNPSATHPRPRRIYAHARILSARCEWFARLLQTPDLRHSSSARTHDSLDASSNVTDPDPGADAGAGAVRWEDGSDSDWEDEESEGEDEGGEPEPQASEAEPAPAPAHVADEDTPPPSAGATGNRRASLDRSTATTPDEGVPGDAGDDVTRVDFSPPGPSGVALGKRVAPPKVLVEDASEASDADEEDVDPVPGRRKRVVEVHDVSYRTLRAFLFYLYTGSIAFAPLRSTYRASRTASRAAGEQEPFLPRSEFNFVHATRAGAVLEGFEDFWASAKSVYWLCDRYGAHELQDAAAQHIRTSLTPENVAEEMCSSFSREFPEIRREQAEYLKAHWVEASASPAFKDLFVRLFASGLHGHTADAGAGELWVDLLRQLRMPEQEREQEYRPNALPDTP